MLIMNEYGHDGLRTWVEVDRSAVAHNYHTFRSVIKRTTKLMAVVKSNAYGHSLVSFAQSMESLGVDAIAVDSVVEALRLREKGVTVPLLVLGYTLPSKYTEAMEHDITITISSLEVLAEMLSRDLPLQVHFKVDTGMHRQGISFDDLAKVKKLFSTYGGLVNLTGLYTHFAVAKGGAGRAYTQRQISEFHVWKSMFIDIGYTPLVHASATAGTLLFPEAEFDMVRIGIGMYGLWPSFEVKESQESKISLIPALSWKSVVGEIKQVPAGEGVGYDLTHTLRRDSVLAVVPVGYWHGYGRALSGRGHVIVRGSRASVIGRVSMGMIILDVSDIPEVQVGDEVILLGRDGHVEVSADELAELSDTINYEIVTRINPKIRRVYVG